MEAKAEPSITDMNLSFTGCGFLGIYHIGAACAIKEYSPDLVRGRMSGVSAGSLAAAALLCDFGLGQATSDWLKVSLLLIGANFL